jgi:hypothetical protein
MQGARLLGRNTRFAVVALFGSERGDTIAIVPEQESARWSTGLSHSRTVAALWRPEPKSVALRLLGKSANCRSDLPGSASASWGGRGGKRRSRESWLPHIAAIRS